MLLKRTVIIGLQKFYFIHYLIFIIYLFVFDNYNRICVFENLGEALHLISKTKNNDKLV